jgi:hypothetical protein
MLQRVEKNEKYYYCCYHRLLLLGMLNSSIFFKTNKGATRNSYVVKSRLIVIMHRDEIVDGNVLVYEEHCEQEEIRHHE